MTTKELPEGYRNLIASIVEAHSVEAVLAALVSICHDYRRTDYLALARDIGQAEHKARMKGL